MSRVCLVVPSSAKIAYQDLADTYSAVEPPTWALLLADALRQEGHEALILDLDAEWKSDEEAVEDIADCKPDLVVFVLYGQNPNSGTTMMIGASTLASLLKSSYSQLKTVFIGSYASALPQELIKESFCDFVFINEGLLGLQSLLETDFINHLDKVPGIWYKKDGIPQHGMAGKLVGGTEIHRVMPGYAWDLLPKKNRLLDKYRAHFWHTNFQFEGRSPFAAIYTSLGCNFSCNFCMINIVNRTSHALSTVSSDSSLMRFWPTDWVLDQLEFLAENGVSTVRISDEMFFLNKKHYIPILEGVIKRGLKFNFWAYARVDSVRRDQLELFKEAGVNWLCLGIEAGNQKVRQEIEKGKFQTIDIRSVVQDIKVAGINILGNYMFGFPEDTLGTMEETLNLALELNCEHANFYTAMALPGSPLYAFSKKSGWDLPKRYEEFAFLSYDCLPLRTKYLSASEVLAFRDYAWNTYFTNSNYLDLVRGKFGDDSLENIAKLSQIKLKRRLLEER